MFSFYSHQPDWCCPATELKMGFENYVFGAENAMENVLEMFEAFESNSEDSDDENTCRLRPERRQYNMLERVHVDVDDEDFLYRFRLSKGTFCIVLEMVKDDLEYSQQR